MSLTPAGAPEPIEVQPPTKPRMSRLAIASILSIFAPILVAYTPLVIGVASNSSKLVLIAGFIFMGLIPPGMTIGVGLAIGSLVSIKRSGGTLRGKALAVTTLIIVCFILVVMIIYIYREFCEWIKMPGTSPMRGDPGSSGPTVN